MLTKFCVHKITPDPQQLSAACETVIRSIYRIFSDDLEKEFTESFGMLDITIHMIIDGLPKVMWYASSHASLGW